MRTCSTKECEETVPTQAPEVGWRCPTCAPADVRERLARWRERVERVESFDGLVSLGAQVAGERTRAELRAEGDLPTPESVFYERRAAMVSAEVKRRRRAAEERAEESARRQHDQWLSNDGPRRERERRRKMERDSTLIGGPVEYLVVKPVSWGPTRLRPGQRVAPMRGDRADQLAQLGVLRRLGQVRHVTPQHEEHEEVPADA